MVKLLVSKVLGKLSSNIIATQKKLYTSTQEIRCKPWFKDEGDKTLRLDYDLNDVSVVFDLGGYEGQWASDIFAKYCSNVYIFEPVEQFCDGINRRFSQNPKIKAYQFGLSSQSQDCTIFLSQDSSSTHQNSGKSEKISLRRAKEFIEENQIEEIHLMKINIEGGEYDLLEHLIETGMIDKIKNIQVQFHDFVENAEQRMFDIQNDLAKTHKLTYQYSFVWENWRLIEENNFDGYY